MNHIRTQKRLVDRVSTEITHQLTMQHIDNLIFQVKQGNPKADIALNFICQCIIRSEKKDNPLPLPAPIRSFDFRDKEGLEKWEQWTKAKKR